MTQIYKMCLESGETTPVGKTLHAKTTAAALTEQDCLSPSMNTCIRLLPPPQPSSRHPLASISASKLCLTPAGGRNTRNWCEGGHGPNNKHAHHSDPYLSIAVHIKSSKVSWRRTPAPRVTAPVTSKMLAIKMAWPIVRAPLPIDVPKEFATSAKHCKR